MVIVGITRLEKNFTRLKLNKNTRKLKIKIKVNTIELFYEQSGAGKPLILLHGNGENHHIFDKITEKLQNDFTVFAIDSRNHGKSMKTDDFSYKTMAEDIYSFICVLNLDNVSIIGFSDGAIISLILAMKHIEGIDKMALLGVNLKPSDFTEKSYQFIKDTYEKTENPLLKVMLEQPNIELEEVRCVYIPTLVIAAEQDIYRPKLFIELSKALPAAELIIMQGHTHDSYIANQDILYNDFIRFFK